MIEFKSRRDKNSRWNVHPGKKKLADFWFGPYIYRINGTIYDTLTLEFKEAFQKELIWQELKR